MSEEDGKTHAKIEVDHPDFETGSKLLSEAIGSDDRDFLHGTINSLAMVARMAQTLIKTK